MTRIYRKGVGGTDAQKLPQGKPTGIVSSTKFSSAALENASDATNVFGAQKENPKRGLRLPKIGPHRAR
jgi:hypothetical protein